tara:strand:+ start:1022 stop:2035 length:1014 start_codon:yes stop_codon:yes gene_type:complete
MIADIVVGLSFGDEGKGKVTHHLLKSGDYTHCLRYNGSNNAGHTIYHEGEKFVLHAIPMGVFFGIKSIIGNGCVVNVEHFFKEIEMLENAGISTQGLVHVAKNTHVITEWHLSEDVGDTAIGTTKRGNGPAYRDKYGRAGRRAIDVPALAPYLIDTYEEFHMGDQDISILCEGAQGFGLDIDWGDYPYVTSSHCTTAGALLNGIPPQAVRKVIGVAKAYDTYVGAKEFHGDGRVFDLLQQLGDEFGATTGRPRQCDWLDIKALKKAVDINGVTDVIINKVDVMREASQWNLRMGPERSIMVQLGSETGWKRYIKRYINDSQSAERVNVIFSESPERI